MGQKGKKGLHLLLIAVMCFATFAGAPFGAAAAEDGEGRAGAALYVAADGDDSAGDGTIDRPYRTLERARDHIRAWKQTSGLPNGGIEVLLREGDYPLLQDSFLLESQDSGTAEAPIVYRSYPGERARLFGGKALDAGAFAAVVDPDARSRLPAGAADRVIAIDLASQGISSADYGGIVHQGQGWPLVPSMMELFVDGQEMTLGRYPNADWLTIDRIVDAGTPGNSGTIDDGPTFVYNDPANRALGWSAADDVWMFGYFFYDWAEENMKVESLDPASRTVTGLQSAWWGINPDLEHRRFYFYNLLEEVDAPGEWYLDRESGTLYLYPPDGFSERSAVEVSFNPKPLIKAQDASYVQFRDLTIEVTRGTGIKTQGGAHNVIAGNVISNTGLYGIEVDGGSHHTIAGNHVFQTGAGGIIASGGDRPTLTPSGHEIVNNHIHSYSRIKKTYAPGIRLNGVGIRVAHNSIHDSAHYAINFSGNDHLIEYNEIFDVLQDSNDSGAIYSATDYSYWGNVIRYNYFHDIIGREGHNVRGVAVYLDDNVSGAEVYGNVMENVGIPFYTHGGRSNRVYENIIINPLYYYVRGIKYGGQAAETPGYNQNSLNNLMRMPYQGELWRTRYPELAVLTNELPVLDPKFNEFTRNIILNQHGVGAQLHAQVTDYGNFDNNYFVDDPDAVFMNGAAGDYRIRPDSDVYAAIDYVDTHQHRAGLLETFPHADAAHELGRLFITTDQPLLNASRVHLAAGESVRLDVMARTKVGEVIPDDALNISYATSDAAVATVAADGVVTGVAAGAAVVTATVEKDGKTASVSSSIVVGEEGMTLDRIELSIDRDAWEVGMEAPTRIRWFTQYGQQLDLSDAATQYTSSAPEIVSVDDAGKVRTLAAGTASVTATTVYDGKETTSNALVIETVETVLTGVEATLSADLLEPGDTAELHVLAVLSNNAKVAPAPGELAVAIERPDVLSFDGERGITALREGGSFIDVAVTIGGTTMTRKLHVSVYTDISSDVPPPWAVKTFGSNGRTGFAHYEDGTFRVVSNGDSMGPSNDSFTFVHRPMPNSAEKYAISATIHSVEQTHPNAAAGLHIRGSINEDKSKGVTLQVTADGRLELVTRSAFQGAAFTKAGGTVDFPVQIKLEKEGTTFVGYKRTADGWEEVARSQNSFNATNNLTSGLSLVSHTHQNEAIQTTEAVFSGIVVGNVDEGPSWPEGSAVAASSVGSDEVTLAWTPAIAAGGIDAYRIVWSDGAATVPGSATSHTVTGLVYDTSYTFRVLAQSNGVWTESGPETTVRTAGAQRLTAELGGPASAAPGETVMVEYRLRHLDMSVIDAVYAQDVTFAYDADRLTFLEWNSLKEGLQIVESGGGEEGSLRFVVISQGREHAVAEDGLLFRLAFEVRPAETSAAGNVSVVRAALADGEGRVVDAAGSSHRIDIVVVDRAALLQTIDEALLLYDDAVEGRFRLQYAVGAKAALRDAIRSAQATAQDEQATQPAIEDAKRALDEALAQFAAARNEYEAGDIDGNGAVNIGDLGILAAAYGASSGMPDWPAKKFADLNEDGKVDVFDLSIVARKLFE